MTDPASLAPRKRRWLLPLLFVSLAVNLLIVGAVAGAMLSQNGPRGGGDQRALRGVVGEPFFRALPEEARRELVRDALSSHERVRDSREALKKRLDAFLTALRDEQFDPAQVARLLGEQRQAAIRRQQLGEELLLKRLVAMSPAERAAYAAALEEKLKSFRRR